jgi:voltage-gated potassium channel
VFATVGFGDITAKTEAARLVVTGQMITDLVIIGLGIRNIVGAVEGGRQRRPAEAGAARSGEWGCPASCVPCRAHRRSRQCR